jgi:hypothetical protein
MTMLVERALALLLCGLCLDAIAADEPVPEADFIEYLGMWEETDEEWLLLDTVPVAAGREREEPEPESDDTTETKDES